MKAFQILIKDDGVHAQMFEEAEDEQVLVLQMRIDDLQLRAALLRVCSELIDAMKSLNM